MTTSAIEPRLGRWASAIGALIAVGIASVPGVIGLVQEPWRSMAVLSIFGAPSVAILGWLAVDRARRDSTRGAAGLAVGMGVAAYVLGVTFFTLTSTVWALVGEGDDLSRIVGPVVVFVFGLLFMLPSLIITIPSAAAWVVIVRRLPDRWLRVTRSGS